jgi:2-succinyl-6-hydroxy-2,4-cyclohexadiene-1-carboxylate synthase
MEGKLYYHSAGDPSAFPILWLHGFLGSHEEWRSLLARFSSRYFQIACDLPGHGKSQNLLNLSESLEGKKSAYGLEATLEALYKLLEHLNISRCFLVGYSLGGRIALAFALRFPHLVHGLVLESTSPGLISSEERETRKRQDEHWARLLEEEGIEVFVEKWYQQPLFASLRKHPHFQELLAKRKQNHATELARSLREIGTGSQPSFWEAWEQHSLPSLILSGSLDLKFIRIAQEMCQKNSSARLEILAECGHNVHAENETAFFFCLQHYFENRLRGEFL